MSAPPVPVIKINEMCIQEQLVSCICDRGEHDIFCEMCGFTLRGRVSKKCPHHEGVFHLMDINCCPRCRSDKLKEV
ncbi:hypothetical protein EB796_022606 [Bugula neritina]|uniref:Uncharacterized protein n=1 Tax=Bugula neritina TaxID=10212 RepID=A0A7J7IYY0_BUGNE|nr:hypothetical protein EB796_022606 [Bugula neritina]